MGDSDQWIGCLALCCQAKVEAPIGLLSLSSLLEGHRGRGSSSQVSWQGSTGTALAKLVLEHSGIRTGNLALRHSAPSVTREATYCVATAYLTEAEVWVHFWHSGSGRRRWILFQFSFLCQPPGEPPFLLSPTTGNSRGIFRGVLFGVPGELKRGLEVPDVAWSLLPAELRRLLENSG